MGISLDDAKPGKGGDVRIGDVVDVHTFRDKAFEDVRILPGSDILVTAQHWITIEKKGGGTARIPKPCLAFNPDTDELDEDIACPYCEMGGKIGRPGKSYYINAIMRELQANEPNEKRKGKPSARERKSGLKDDIRSKSWTPVRVLRLPTTALGLIQDLKDLNFHNVAGEETPVSVVDAEYGCDVSIKYDSKATAASKYMIQKKESEPLDDEELSYLRWDLTDTDTLFPRETYEAALKDLQRMNIVEDEENEDGGGNKRKGKTRREEIHDDEDDDDYTDADELVIDDDEEEDDAPPPPKRKAKSKASTRKKAPEPEPEEEEDDDLLDVDDDPDFDEDEPPPKRKAGAKPKDEDEEDLDDDPVEEDEELDLDLDEEESFDDEEEEEESAPPPKRKPARKPAGKARSTRRR